MNSLDTAVSLLALATMALAAYGMGRPLVRALQVVETDWLAATVWSMAIGLLIGGTTLAVLGLCGALYGPLIGVLTLCGACWALGEIGREYVRYYEFVAVRDCADAPTVADDESRAPWAPPSPWVLWGALLLAAAACVGSGLAALAPPTAGDALCYHLELPKAFLAEHRLVYLPYHDNCTYPLLAQMWYLWGIAVQDAVTAQLVHWGLGLLLALATVVLATPIIGRRWGWVVGAVVLLVPGVNNQMTTPLNDMALALMTTLAVAAWWRAVVDNDSRRWLVLAGLATGGALATKYTALLFVAAMAIIWTGTLLRRTERRRLIEAAAIVGVIAVTVAGLWYARAAWYRGNPVYPFFQEIVAQVPEGAAAPSTLPESKSPLGRGPWAMSVAPWQITMEPEQFGGRGHRLGVLLLAFVPGLGLARRLRGLGMLLGLSAAYAVVWFLLRQNVRFLLPVVPLLAVGVVWVWVELRRFPRWPRRAAVAAAVIMLAVSSALALARCRQELAVACGLESREDYLYRMEPTYAAADLANQLLPPESHLLSQDYRTFYFKCRTTREITYRRRTGYDRWISSADDLHRYLRRAGFTHLLLAENTADKGIQFDDTLPSLADAADGSPDAKLFEELTSYRFRDADGAVRQYRLVALR